MRHYFFGLMLFAFSMAFARSDAQGYLFNWADPTSLTPAFSAPTENNRYGEYISNVTFTCGPVSLTINDDNVAQASQKSRFLWGYMTRIVEMRSYVNSTITITVPEGESITSISFDGAAASSVQMEYEGGQGTFSGKEWFADPQETVSEVTFYVAATINCTSTLVRVSTSGVDEISCDASAEEKWYTLGGTQLLAKPQTAGFYIKCTGSKAEKVIIR